MSSREIKFRAWDKKNKRFESCSMGEFVMIVQPKNGEWGSLSLEEFKEGFEINQFTGLRDKNSTEIYEGDIVKSPEGNLYEVRFSPKENAFLLYSIKKNSLFLYLGGFPEGTVEIVGNIYTDTESAV